MAITYEGAGALQTRNGTGSISGAWPSGYSPVANDVAIVLLSGPAGGSSPTTTISGYTFIGRQWRSSSTYGIATESFYRVLDGSESVPSFTSGYTYSVGITVLIFRGVSSSTPIDASAVAGEYFNNTTWTPPGVTTSSAGAMVISTVATQSVNNLGLESGNERGFTAPVGGSSYSYNDTGSTEFSVGLAYKEQTTAGSVTNPTWKQNAGGTVSWVGVTYALKAAVTPTGTVDVNQAPQTMSAAGTVPYAGSINVTQANQTTSISAFYGYGGIVNTTAGNDTLAAVGYEGWYIFPDGIDGSNPPPGIGVYALVPQVFDPATYDSRTEPSGPDSIRLFDPLNPPSPYIPRVTAQLVSSNGTTILSNLDNAFNIEWRDALNEPGFGRISVPASEADAALLVPGRYVRCLLDGVVRFTWLIETQPERVRVDPGEEYGEVVIAQGRGWIAQMGSALVYPEGGMTNPLNPQHRTFSFATPVFPNESWGWTNVTYVEGKASDLLPPRIILNDDEIVAAPAGFPDPDAYWTWATPLPHQPGKCFFRNTFDNPVDQSINIAASADNFYTVYLDGIPIMGESEDSLCWQRYKEVTIFLPAGEYVIGVVVENYLEGNAPYSQNPAGFVLSVFPSNQPPPVTITTGGELISPPYPGPPMITQGLRNNQYVSQIQARLNQLGFNSGPVDGYFGPVTYAAVVAFQTKYNLIIDGKVGPQTWTALFGEEYSPATTVTSKGLIGRLLWSDTNWTKLAYPDTDPGWTAGQIMSRLMSEASSRGTISNIMKSFRSYNDSAGRSWTSGAPNYWMFIPSFSVPVGSSLLSVLDSLAKQGWVDYRMRPGTRTLDMWSANTGGVRTSVTFAKDVNIRALTFEPSDIKVNRVVIKWNGGWITVQDSADIATNGAFEQFLTVDTNDIDEARRQGYVLLNQYKDANAAIVVEVEPSASETPYQAFTVGDYIYSPNTSGVSTSYRVISIAVQQDDMGDPKFTLELNRRSRMIERQQNDVIRTLSGGVLGVNSTNTLDSSQGTSVSVRLGQAG